MINIKDLKSGQICLWKYGKSKEVYLILDVDVNIDTVKCMVIQSTGNVSLMCKTYFLFKIFDNKLIILSDKEALPYRKLLIFS